MTTQLVLASAAALVSAALASFAFGLYRRGPWSARAGLRATDSLKAKEFAHLVGAMMRRRGLEPLLDEEADAERPFHLRFSRGSEIHLVQINKGRSSRLGPGKVRTLRDAIEASDAAGGVIVASGTVDPAALTVRDSDRIDIVHGEVLWRELEPLVETSTRIAARTHMRRALLLRGIAVVLVALLAGILTLFALEKFGDVASSRPQTPTATVPRTETAPHTAEPQPDTAPPTPPMAADEGPSDAPLDESPDPETAYAPPTEADPPTDPTQDTDAPSATPLPPDSANEPEPAAEPAMSEDAEVEAVAAPEPEPEPESESEPVPVPEPSEPTPPVATPEAAPATAMFDDEPDARRAAALASVLQAEGVDSATWSTRSTLVVEISTLDPDLRRAITTRVCERLLAFEELRYTRLQIQEPGGRVRWDQCQ